MKNYENADNMLFYYRERDPMKLLDSYIGSYTKKTWCKVHISPNLVKYVHYVLNFSDSLPSFYLLKVLKVAMFFAAICISQTATAQNAQIPSTRSVGFNIGGNFHLITVN